MGDDELFPNPDNETAQGLANDKETLGGAIHHRPPPWSVGDKLGDFVLETVLGSGSSGYVYRVRDDVTQRHFALKLLHHGPADDLLRNKLGFRRMMMFDHPNLLRVDRIHQLDSYIGLSMEEIEGQTFRLMRTALTGLPRDEAYAKLLNLIRDYAAGLAAMHGSGLVHRDIKPENLMVDAQGRGRIIDYGLVDSYEIDHPTFEARGVLVGTRHYLSPEVICRQKYLPAGDIFGLGIVLLDTLRLLERDVVGDVGSVKRHKNVTNDAARLGEALDDLPESVPGILRETCREMLDRHPSDRPTALALGRLGKPPKHPVMWSVKPSVVGRDDELQQCKAWVDRVLAGSTERLHLSGDTGVGKSRLIDEIVQYIEAPGWAQVFVARCRSREDQPLQSFDQICDAIAHRYMKGDRGRVPMDPVSLSILQSVFPVLENVLESSLKVPPLGESTDSLDALEAAARFSEQLRQVGPLFLVIDDSQWADHDSRSVLDNLLLTSCDVGLGIITVAREENDLHRVPASLALHLDPLPDSEAATILTNSASRWGVDVSQEVLDRLVQLAAGFPFRLQELAEEFRPGGALHELAMEDASGLPDLSPLHRLWQHRAERLSPEAKRVLPMIVTARGQASIEQLGKLTGLGDEVDAAVTELVRQRLAIDEATGGECITIYHDRTAEELTKSFSEAALQDAHHEWAKLLVHQNNSEGFAARIAQHFYAAGQPGRAVAHAILAAEDAERRVAKAEAGRWYASVIENVHGEERVRQVRNAARCFREADNPMQAAKYYHALSYLVEGEERIECMLLASSASIRCGKTSQIRQQLHELARLLKLPKPKSGWKGHLSLGWQLSRNLLTGPASMSEFVSSDKFRVSTSEAHQANVELEEDDATRRNRQAIRLCQSLIRPLSIFDNQYAAELSLAGARLAARHGSPAQQLHVAVGEAVFGCYDSGRKRIESEASLLMLRPKAEELGSETAIGDVWSGIAYSHALSCRWDHVSQPVQAAVDHYERVADANRFEIAHTRWIDLWAKWHLGQWSEMRQLGDLMLDDAIRRDDTFQQIVAMGGYGVGAWLTHDRMAEVEYRRRHANDVLGTTDRLQLFESIDSIAVVQTHLYQGRLDDAWEARTLLNDQLKRRPFSRLQMLRVANHLLGAMVGLNHFARSGETVPLMRVEKCGQALRSERIGFAHAMADYVAAMLVYYQRLHGQTKLTDSAVIERLQQAGEACRQRLLRPYYWCLTDAAAAVRTGTTGDRLQERMRKADVTYPQMVQRLYGVADSDRDVADLG